MDLLLEIELFGIIICTEVEEYLEILTSFA